MIVAGQCDVQPEDCLGDSGEGVHGGGPGGVGGGLSQLVGEVVGGEGGGGGGNHLSRAAGYDGGGESLPPDAPFPPFPPEQRRRGLRAMPRNPSTGLPLQSTMLYLSIPC